MVAYGKIFQNFVVVVLVDVVLTACCNVDDLDLVILHTDEVVF